MRKKWFGALLLQRVWVTLLIILQALFILYLLLTGSVLSMRLNHLLTAISLIAVLYIISKKDKGAYKLTWVFLILMFPVFGGALYLLFSLQTSTRRFKKMQDKQAQFRPAYHLPGNCYDQAAEKLSQHLPQIRYLQQCAGFPIYDQTQVDYYSPGEAFFEALIPELEKAERYIFLEFFIIEEGKMWGTILDVLERKAKQGVRVRLLYDDIGCFFTLPKNYAQRLRRMGIECEVFNRFRPLVSVLQNNRDHRKIISIDGKVAFTGGINLADEYINAYEKHGHWKDSGVCARGKAAWSLTVMFLDMWSLCTNGTEDVGAYYPWKDESCLINTDGFVQPYADSPMDHENVGEHVYLQIINSAKDYIYITTPYLIVDDSMISALTLAAKSGVDVRIITPRIWDKRMVHMTTRSYYRDLTKAGVKIYEYTKGFVHAKTFVSDEHIATVGTTNLDFRSLYLHFECGVLMFGSSAVKEVKADFLKTLENCQQITEKDCRANAFMRLMQDILRLYAPLM